MTEKTIHSKACVGIAAIVGVISIGIVALVAIFVPSHLPVAAWIVAPLCFMGVALGFLSGKSGE